MSTVNPERKRRTGEQPRIWMLEPKDFSIEGRRALEEFASVSWTPATTESLRNDAHLFDVLWLRLGFRLNEAALGESGDIRAIVCPATGSDHIDHEWCTRQGIDVLTLKGEGAFLREVRATAEHTIGLALTLLRKTVHAHAHVLQGGWERDPFRGAELYQKTLGIIGFGRLGSIVAELGKSFGMRLIAFDPLLTAEERAPYPYVRFVDTLEELASTADVASCHVVLEEDTVNLIGEAYFAAAKRGQYFINTARGQIVDTKAVLDALKGKSLAGAALDVVAGEPEHKAIRVLSEYAKENSNLILTPHIAGNTRESFVKTEVFMAMKLKTWWLKKTQELSSNEKC